MNFLNKVIEDDFVWNAIYSAIAGKAKRGTGGFLQVNCPLCVDRGARRPDRRRRCAIRNNHPGVGYFCFNCGAKGTFVPGSRISRSMKELLIGLGVSDTDVKRLAHRAATYQRMIESSPEAMALVPTQIVMDFPAKPLPPLAASFETWANNECDDPDFLKVVEYLFGRGEDVANATTYYWSPDTKHNMNLRVIIPFYHNGKIVGWTGRAVVSGIEPKYHSESPPDYLFNNHVLDSRKRKFAVVVEGVFDALAIDGVATLGAKLNDRQASWIDSTGVIPIIVPDRDEAGKRLIDVAIRRKWHAAFPALRSGITNWWDTDTKDVADAVGRYGRLYTLTSLLKSAVNNKTELEIKKKMLF